MPILTIELSEEDVDMFIDTFNAVTTGAPMTRYEFDTNIDDLATLVKHVIVGELPHVIAHVESLGDNDDELPKFLRVLN